jgi:hypothetical protein
MRRSVVVETYSTGPTTLPLVLHPNMEYCDQICMALNGDVLAGWGPKRDAAFDGRVAVPGNLNTFSRW